MLRGKVVSLRFWGFAALPQSRRRPRRVRDRPPHSGGSGLRECQRLL